MNITRFNVRVYGILIDESRILLSDEIVQEQKITKFPGGGLQFGEGARDCIQREFLEETAQQVQVLEHFYTTDFFLPSAFNEKDQIISIYFLVTTTQPEKIEVKTQKFDFDQTTGDTEVFRWIKWESFTEKEVTLPADKKVVRLLKDQLSV